MVRSTSVDCISVLDICMKYIYIFECLWWNWVSDPRYISEVRSKKCTSSVLCL